MLFSSPLPSAGSHWQEGGERQPSHLREVQPARLHVRTFGKPISLLQGRAYKTWTLSAPICATFLILTQSLKERRREGREGTECEALTCCHKLKSVYLRTEFINLHFLPFFSDFLATFQSSRSSRNSLLFVVVLFLVCLQKRCKHSFCLGCTVNCGGKCPR